ncbi:MAG: hypothetical protein K6A63_05355 [Acholeplasmatales bacterium]|nr:hypothetical protein [Acholeplasmatales bacterium]
MSKRSAVIIPISILVILICLGGVAGMYYLAFTTAYKSEAYMFMGFNILFWFVFGMMVMIMSSSSKEALKRDYVRKHGHLERVEIICLHLY